LWKSGREAGKKPKQEGSREGTRETGEPREGTEKTRIWPKRAGEPPIDGDILGGRENDATPKEVQEEGDICGGIRVSGQVWG
jgi:hypothetical protein